MNVLSRGYPDHLILFISELETIALLTSALSYYRHSKILVRKPVSVQTSRGKEERRQRAKRGTYAESDTTERLK